MRSAFAPSVLVVVLVSAGAILGCKKGSNGTTTADTATAPSGAAPAGTADFPAPADVAAAPADAQKTPSGLASKVLKPGKGTDKPNKWDEVVVHYTGWQAKDGKMFDTSLRGEPVSFGLREVIAGWTEGMQLMVKGEKRRFWIPSALAYGEKARKGAPAGDLVFDVELLEIKPGEKPIPAPDDVKAPPADAKKTASGLAYKTVTPGKGKTHPNELSKVRVHYTGWTTAGDMFDSSVMRKQPAEFSLRGVIKGWTEGVQLMTEGEKTRFWIPAEMAYGEHPQRPGAPAGMLVFDIELLDILSMPDGGGATAAKGAPTASGSSSSRAGDGTKTVTPKSL